MPIHVGFRREAGHLKALAAPLRDLVRAVLADEGLRPGEIAVVLSGDAEVRDLNRRYRGIDRATDVLSFGLGSEPHPSRRGISGDIVISLDQMARQARRYRVSRGKELARLVIHGALHLAGHDHQRAAERRDMRAREERSLRRASSFVRTLDRLLAHAIVDETCPG